MLLKQLSLCSLNKWQVIILPFQFSPSSYTVLKLCLLSANTCKPTLIVGQCSQLLIMLFSLLSSEMQHLPYFLNTHTLTL